MSQSNMSDAEQAYNFPPPPEGPMNLWVAEPGGVPPLLGQLAEGFRQMVLKCAAVCHPGRAKISSTPNRRLITPWSWQ